MSPLKDFHLDMYVDATFSGLWHKNYVDLHDSALFCSGYVITYYSCPIHWMSKIQFEIALSTNESEYIALSMATWDLLPLPYGA
jgi:hypothetical protein